MGFQVVIESQINISKSSQWFMQCQQDSCGYLLSHSLCLLNYVTWQINSTH